VGKEGRAEPVARLGRGEKADKKRTATGAALSAAENLNVPNDALVSHVGARHGFHRMTGSRRRVFAWTDARACESGTRGWAFRVVEVLRQGFLL
jgi:hypothetical protein